MRVIIEILTGRLFYVEIKEDATVEDLKREIGFQEHLPLDRLILLVDHDRVNGCSNLMTEDEIALQDYGVKDGSHVYLFFETVDEDGCHFLLPSSGQDFMMYHQPSSYSYLNDLFLQPATKVNE
ncbi:OLC1v1017919C1 [Oldenlandia corymbosa var. corymbosa]|uniref:OLC1v1017919C1 n=1 Tax=Oldenlandia corymbosa var. corymbosa TaxID=529605 RepID=A0AAV1EAN1_OLDCO|nr:OLC1v1017919C1 [Oldenlandia corymbosa var. corymbosa]